MPPRKRNYEDVESEDDWEYVSSGSDGEGPSKPQKKVQAKKPRGQAASMEKKDKQPRQKKEKPEKRTGPDGKAVRWSSTASQSVQQRIHRALPGSGHRMFLIATEVRPAGAPEGRTQEFTVLGATGNVYTVRISRHPTCDCPDHAKGNLCKHILFIYLRALKLAPNNPLVWQKALLTTEVEEVLGGRHSTGSDAADVLASASVRAGYARMTAGQAGGCGGSGAAEDGVVRRKVEGDCAICFDDLKGGHEAISWCASCGNNLHTKCCDQWVRMRHGQHQDVSCVYCRAPWVDGSKPAAAAGAGPAAPGGYVNLKQYSEAHRTANTSLQALYPDTAQYIERGWRGSQG